MADNTPAHNPTRSSLPPWLRLLRPMQWSESAFVFIGPFYGMVLTHPAAVVATLIAAVAFALASSACYVLNDIADVNQDRLHPRKSRRPIASGEISIPAARSIAIVLLLISLASIPLVGYSGLLGELLPIGKSATTVASASSSAWHPWPAALFGLALIIYVGNTLAYSQWIKHKAIGDVVSLAMGFVLRVLGGCAAASVEPSTFLLNCTFFLAMYLAFGKRLGERRTMGDATAAASTRSVQARYTDELLRMVVVVCAVALLVTYAGYVQAPAQADRYTQGFNLLWVTMLPATYAMLRSILLLETGQYDDPTELAVKDRPFQLAAAAFVVITVGLMIVIRK